MRFLKIALIFSLCSLVLGQDIQKSTVAVIEFEGQGISPVETSILASRFRNELVNTQAFIVIERGQMESLLEEVGFQQTGCTTSECMIEIGRILNVRHMIGGSIGKFGDVYTLDLRMINVETAQIIETVSEDHQGKLTDLLKVIKNVAYRFAARRQTDQPKTEAKPLKGSLSLSSTPDDALIYLNDEEVGETPKTLPDLNRGEYSVRIEKEGYIPYESTIVILPGKTAEISASLIALFELQVISEPSAANLYIDNVLIGKTPYRGLQPAGRHTIKLVKKNFVDYTREVNLSRSGKITAKMDLTPEYLARMQQTRKRQETAREDTQIEPDTEDAGGNTWLWIGVGVAAAGGAAIFLLSGGDGGGDGNGELEQLPDPPARPN